MAYAPYAGNPAQEALQNSAMLQQMFAQPLQSIEQAQRAKLAFAMQQKQAQMEHQYALQRQLSQQSFEKGQQEKALSAAEERQKAQIEGENLRQGITVQTQKDLELQAEVAAKELSKQDIGLRAAATAKQSTADIAQRAKEMRDAKNVEQAEFIRHDPRSSQILGSDFIAKLDLTDPKDAAKLVATWEQKATPKVLETLDAQRIANIRGQTQDLTKQIQSYPNSPQGQSQYTKALLSDPTIQKLLLAPTMGLVGSTQMNAQQLQMLLQNPLGTYNPKTMAPDPNGIPGTDIVNKALQSRATWFWGAGDTSIAQQIATAAVSAKQAMMQNPSPDIQGKIMQLQDLNKLGSTVYNQGNIITPEGHSLAFGTATPMTQTLRAAGAGNFETPLSSTEEAAFQEWKKKYAPNDNGVDYDYRGAFKAGLTPSPANGHWPDTFKKPNHPTFSDQSIYAPQAPDRAGHWNGDNYVPGPAASGMPAYGLPQPLVSPGLQFNPQTAGIANPYNTPGLGIPQSPWNSIVGPQSYEYSSPVTSGSGMVGSPIGMNMSAAFAGALPMGGAVRQPAGIITSPYAMPSAPRPDDGTLMGAMFGVAPPGQVRDPNIPWRFY